MNQFYERFFNIMIMTQTRIVEDIIPECMVTRMIFVNTKVNVRHNKNHGIAFAFCNQVLHDLNGSSSFSPRPLMAIDSVNQIEYR